MATGDFVNAWRQTNQGLLDENAEFKAKVVAQHPEIKQLEATIEELSRDTPQPSPPNSSEGEPPNFVDRDKHSETNEPKTLAIPRKTPSTPQKLRRMPELLQVSR